MATVAVAFPVLPGKSEDGRRFAEEVSGPRSQEMAESQRRLGVTTENWYLQSTPQGDMIIVYMEARDPLYAFQEWARSNDPFDVWFKQRAGSISGIDFSQPLPALPEQLYGYGG